MADEANPEAPTSMVRALPVPAGPARPGGERSYEYRPFSTSDLYNWKTQTPSFSEKPQGLIDLLESILFTHNPLGMIVSSYYKCFSPQRNVNGYCRKHRRMFQG